MSKPLIQVIGSLHIDFTSVTPRCPGPGETIQAKRLEINPGGKGANQAVGCGRASFTSKDSQDVDVQMIGAVGKDDPYYAKLLRPALEKSGVSTSHITEIPNVTTGNAVIIVDEGAGGENRILFTPGADFVGMDEPTEILARSASGNRVPEIVVLQGEIPKNTVLSLLDHFNHNGQTKVIFNPAPVWPDGIPGKSLQGLSVLVVNETEHLLLMKAMAQQGYEIETVESEADLSLGVLQRIAGAYHKHLKLEVLIVTLGSKGVFYSQAVEQEAATMTTTMITSDIIPAVKVDKVLDTTAAGDTFVGYIATEFARALHQKASFNVQAACEKANAASAKCVARPGAMDSIPFGYE